MASEEDDEIGVCTECGSDQPDQYMIRSPFFQQGGSVPCKWCGGVTMVVKKSVRDQALRQSNRQRKLE